jgi:hypothetical protein
MIYNSMFVGDHIAVMIQTNTGKIGASIWTIDASLLYSLFNYLFLIKRLDLLKHIMVFHYGMVYKSSKLSAFFSMG